MDESAFDFEEWDGERGRTGGVETGASDGWACLTVDVATPTTVVGGWNSRHEVTMVRVDSERMCLGKIEGEPRGGEAQRDFRACSLVRMGLSCVGDERACGKFTHAEEGRGGRGRFDATDPAGIFAIAIPTSGPHVVQQGIFSRPVFRVSKFPRAMRPRHELLLDLTALPRVFKYVLEGYPGESKIWAMYSSIETSLATPARGVERMVGNTPGDAPGVASLIKVGGRTAQSSRVPEAVASTAMASLRAGAPRKSPPGSIGREEDHGRPRAFAWEADLSVEADDHSQATSIAGLSTLSESALLQQAVSKLNELAGTVRVMKAENRRREASLGTTIMDLRRQVAAQQTEIEDLKMEGVGDPLFGGGSIGGGNYSLTLRDRRIIAEEVAESMGMDSFVTRDDLSKEGKRLRDIFDPSRYVTHEELRRFDYVSNSRVRGMGFATQQEVTDAIDARLQGSRGLPTNVEARLTLLEKEVLRPGGAFAVLQEKVQAMQQQKAGSAVSAGGYTFKDIASTQAWALAVGEADLMRYCLDARQQLTMLGTKVRLSEDIIKEAADVRKGGVTSPESAKVVTSFTIEFPETIYRVSTAAKDAHKGGIVFMPAFTSADVFEGNIEHSTKATMLKTLENNQRQGQAAIDARFPPDQLHHTKIHAVLSHIMRKGYYQAVGFVESILPFYRMLTGAQIDGTTAWERVLGYTKAVFTRIHEVRTQSMDRTQGAMIYGMLLSTQLLEGYALLGWIRHPDVSSSLVISALKKDAGQAANMAKKLEDGLKIVKANQGAIEKLQSRLRTNNEPRA